jgi:transcription factor IIIB subunit 2
MLAIKLIQTMDRAWISVGRRPNGLCGSAILLASRVLGFKRSTTQIVKVVHAHEQTVRRRFKELKNTEMLKLSVHEIKRIALAPSDKLKRTNSQQSVEENLDPPIVRQRLRNELHCTESELSRYLNILDTKAKKMDEKLHNKEEKEENLDFEEDSEVRELAAETKVLSIITRKVSTHSNQEVQKIDDEDNSNLSHIEVDTPAIAGFLCTKEERTMKK